MMLKAPRALHLYQECWRCPELIVSSWNCLSPGSFVGMGNLAVRELDSESELVLEVYTNDETHFVLVKEVDSSLEELCRWWKQALQTGIRNADAGVLEKVEDKLRPYQRAALRLV
ncbi:MAG: hypothetical protein KA066_01820 [Candidatus Pacebacteria bacterium]|nr:hypothetical protein [Candidatus Paceibacterota bacterium]